MALFDTVDQDGTGFNLSTLVSGASQVAGQVLAVTNPAPAAAAPSGPANPVVTAAPSVTPPAPVKAPFALSATHIWLAVGAVGVLSYFLLKKK